MRRSRPVLGIAVGALLGALAAGCDPDVPRVPPADCNPIADGACLLPWPSSFYLVPDATTKTGFRVSLPAAAMPHDERGRPVDPTPYARWDGFSPAGALIVGFEGGVAPDGLPGPDEVERTTRPDSPVLLLPFDGGAPVPLLVEIDHNASRPEHATLLIRPLVRLEPATRYIAAVRRGLRSADGAELAPPPVFAALVRGETVDHPLLGRVAGAYPKIFARLEQLGVRRGELLLAWDFVTASDDMLTGDLRTMRAVLDEVAGTHGDGLGFDASEAANPGDPAVVHRHITGTFEVPYFLVGPTRTRLRLARDAAGRPALQGLGSAPLAAIIPACAVEQAPLPVIVMGHGLFGSGGHSLRDWHLLHDVANEVCAVLVATDYLGLSSLDVGDPLLVMRDLDRASNLADKLPQGVLNTMALSRIVRGPLARSPLFEVNGRPVIDPERVSYYGVSLGGILGNVVMAYEPGIGRAALAVPGGNWSMLLERSENWTLLGDTLRRAYPDPFDYQLSIALLAMLLEPTDPVTTARRLVTPGRQLAGVPPKEILMIEAVGDAVVTNLATEMIAREIGLPVTTPTVRLPFGLVPGGAEAPSALTIYDERLEPPPPPGNTTPSVDNHAHDRGNNIPAAQRQIRAFLRGEPVRHECRLGGELAPCDCSTGACD